MVPGAPYVIVTGPSTMLWWLVEQLAFPLLYVPSLMVHSMALGLAMLYWMMSIALGMKLTCSHALSPHGAMFLRHVIIVGTLV